jgi:hypothetical protein
LIDKELDLHHIGLVNCECLVCGEEFRLLVVDEVDADGALLVVRAKRHREREKE